MNPAGLFKMSRDLRKEGRGGEALDLLRDTLRRGQLDPEGIDWAGRIIREVLREGGGNQPPLRVLLLGQCTTSWLVTALTAVSWGGGIPTLVSEGGYDNVLQDLNAQKRGDERPDAIVLLPSNRRLIGGARAASDLIKDELAFWRQAWATIAGRLGSRIVQVGYDWVVPGAAGHALGGRPDGPVDLVRRINAEVRSALPEDAFFVDLEQVSGTIGRAAFYDMRRDYWTKQPFSEAGICLLAEHLWAGVRAITTGPKKVLVVDLDNTLWGGVVGETGPLGIALGDSPEGEAFRAFQRHLKDLAARGVVLAVASKNNPEDAREPFEKNPDMILGPDDFGAWEVCWEPKGATIARIAQALNLGLDSLVFFDDNPAEREEVRRALPEVEVVEVPDDPAEFVRALQAGLWFEASRLTEADRERTGQYVAGRKRRELEQSFATLDEFLGSLEMRAEVRPIDEADLQRVVQLLAKTNQFNLTTRRHTRDDVLDLIARPGAVALSLRVRDKFGDHGLVSVLIGVPAEGDALATMRIDTWLMSCRVIGRTVEQFFLGTFLERGRRLGFRRFVGEYIPTKKNSLVSGLYEELGFRPIDGADRVMRYVLEEDDEGRLTTFVMPEVEALAISD